MKKYPTISENIGGLSIAQLDLLKSDNRNKVHIVHSKLNMLLNHCPEHVNRVIFTMCQTNGFC
ncbi:hypothetical protein LINPERPRIM_LOCUS20317 [Linum perenne]